MMRTILKGCTVGVLHSFLYFLELKAINSRQSSFLVTGVISKPRSEIERYQPVQRLKSVKRIISLEVREP